MNFSREQFRKKYDAQAFDEDCRQDLLAEARDVRFNGGSHWGPGAPRRLVKGGVAKLNKINRDAYKFHAGHGRWPRVFCSSLSDIFDNAVPEMGYRTPAFAEIEAASNCQIQL